MILVFHSFFEKVSKGHLKMVRSRYIVILTKPSKGSRISFQSPALSQKHVSNVRHTQY